MYRVSILPTRPCTGLAYCLPDHVQPCQTANIKQKGKCGQEYTKNSGKEINLSRKLEILVRHTH